VPKAAQRCAAFSFVRIESQGRATLRNLLFCPAIWPAFLCTSPCSSLTRTERGVFFSIVPAERSKLRYAIEGNAGAGGALIEE
jgi:hypothetical protein